MPKVEQPALEWTDKVRLIKQLENLGNKWWLERWREHIAIPSEINPLSMEKHDHERVLRYATLRAVINQQADAQKARELPRALYDKFGDRLLLEPNTLPFSLLASVLKEIAGPKGRDLYHVGSLGGIKPISLFLYRYAAFSNFVVNLKTSYFDRILELLKGRDGVQELHAWLRDTPDLEAGWVGNDPKACRMLVDWILFLFSEVWKEPIRVSMKDSLMIVDGHVAKVFVRAGLLDTIQIVKAGSSIIYAMKMRSDIEQLVGSIPDIIPFYVDNGAFSLFHNEIDTDLDPKCEVCPITDTCLKFKHWTAYKESNYSVSRSRSTAKAKASKLRESPSLFDTFEETE